MDKLAPISTHTLTWSVTLYLPLLYTISTPFQLTRSRGAWHDGQERKEHQKNFNSHAHVERDQTPHQCRRYIRHFNSHAHVERDDGEDRQSNKIKISTHTLTWSVTQRWYDKNCRWKFQLTRSRGAWRFTVEFSITSLSFQLTRSRGAWQSSKWRYCFWRQFQLTRSRGAWPLGVWDFEGVYSFQLTRSRGAWHVWYKFR